MSFIIIRSSAYDYLVFLFQFDLSIAGYKSIWHMIELGMVIVSQVPKAFESVVITENIEEGVGVE